MTLKEKYSKWTLSVILFFFLSFSSNPVYTQSLVDSDVKYLQSSNYHQNRDGLQNCHIKFEREKKGRVAFLGGSITHNPGWAIPTIHAYT